jgi:hypothetical protein
VKREITKIENTPDGINSRLETWKNSQGKFLAIGDSQNKTQRIKG